MTISGVVLASLFGVSLGFGAFTMKYAEATSYLSSDPKACVNCHIMRDPYDAWQKGPHHGVATCNDCHVPHDLVGKYYTKAEHGYRHSRGFTFQDFHEPIQIKASSLRVVEGNCLRCHIGLVNDVEAYAQASGESVDCVHCHSSAGHGPCD